MDLKLCQFNNYFNRQIKRYDTLDEYSSYVKYTSTNINFNPNDGVNATAIVGVGTDVTDTFDYAILVDGTTIVSRWFIMDQTRLRGKQYQLTLKRDVIADNYASVISAPCFIQKGTIADDTDPAIFNNEGLQVNQIKTALDSTQGGDENGELLLKDSTKCPWIVGYIAKNAGEIKGDVNWDSGKVYNIELSTSIAAWEYYKYKDEDFIGPLNELSFIINYQLGLNLPMDMQYIKIGKEGDAVSKGLKGMLGAALRVPYTSGIDKETASKVSTAFKNVGMSYFISDLNTLVGAHTDPELSALQDFNGAIIKDSNGQYFRITVNNTGTITKNDTAIVSGQDLYTRMASAVVGSGAFDEDHNTPNDKSFEYNCSASKYRLIIDELKDYTTSYDIPSTRVSTSDAIYDVFCIPYGEVNVIDTNTGSTVMTTNKELGTLTAISMSSVLTTSKLYDLQLLPYCPLQNSIGDGSIKIDTSLTKPNYAYVTDAQNNNVGIILFSETSSGSFTISAPLSIPRDQTSTTTTKTARGTAGAKIIRSTATQCVCLWSAVLPGNRTSLILGMEDLLGTGTIVRQTKTISMGINTFQTTFTGLALNVLTASSTHDLTWLAYYNQTTTTYDHTLAHDLKVANECDLYRLVSPNFNGQFEFNVAKNGGSVASFDVDYTYKPYNPYIHVVPEFHNLYGYDANDARGLICNGDFSFGAIADQWQSYEIQNKNYNAIFNRQIENMDVNNKIAKTEAGWQMAVGTLQGAGTGAATGTMVGGFGVGTAVGAAVGAVSSLGGGIADMVNLNKRQEEARSFAIDSFNYQLGNIKALPYSLTKCSALTKNNKFWPFVEYYTCTDVEKDALESKLTYNGMTIMRISTINDWLGTDEQYIQGQLIRLSDITDDSHMANEIYNEIAKGVYL